MKVQESFTAQKLNTWYFIYQILGIAETLSIKMKIIKMEIGSFKLNLYFP